MFIEVQFILTFLIDRAHWPRIYVSIPLNINETIVICIHIHKFQNIIHTIARLIYTKLKNLVIQQPWVSEWSNTEFRKKRDT